VASSWGLHVDEGGIDSCRGHFLLVEGSKRLDVSGGSFGVSLKVC
jgi:hypothetical protein